MRYRRYITNRYKRYIYPAIIKEYFEYLRSLLVKVSGNEDEAVAAIEKFYESHGNGGRVYVQAQAA